MPGPEFFASFLVFDSDFTSSSSDVSEDSWFLPSVSELLRPSPPLPFENRPWIKEPAFDSGISGEVPFVSMSFRIGDSYSVGSDFSKVSAFRDQFSDDST